MKVSEITVSNIAGYLKLEPGEYTESEFTPLLTVAKNFISAYTGIPITSDDTTVKTLDDYEDFYIVVMILCQDMHYNRSLYVDKNNLNKVVETILGMHCINLL
jgi:hypothetical protein